MRTFVAACCCAIVGLEVLIAVPLITCLVVLGIVGGMDVPQVAIDVPGGTQQYVSTPFMLPPPLSPAGFSGPTIGPPPPINYAPPCDSQLPCPVAESVAAVAPPQLSPQVEAIAEVHERLGSPLADSSLAGDPAATRADTIAALEHVAAQDAAPTLPLPAAPSLAESISPLNPAPLVAGAGECPQACPSECPAKPSLVESLRAAADQLYVKAQELEIDGNFSRADQLRTLARGIRTEIDLLRDQSTPLVPAPSAVTSLSPPLLLSPSPSLIPTQAQLVRPTALPAEITIVPATYVIPEEVEDTLVTPTVEQLPQIPAP